MDSRTINMIFGYATVQNCEYVTLGVKPKQYVLFQAFTLCWYLDLSYISPQREKCIPELGFFGTE